jgi:rhamnose utilization protein RhaD (predicted bifunctional aldolase and dehydrogenase)/NAD(P)-dependent dehydrogenase (short-subunit alcohol dehydrogenase family)
MKGLQELVDISNYFGKNKDYVVAGGGNTSYKDKKHIWVKASGYNLADIKAEGFAKVDRAKVEAMFTKTYSKETLAREEEVKKDLVQAVADNSGLRPSVETAVHHAIEYPFVIHLHPWMVNALTCSRNAEKHCLDLFGQDSLYIEYTDPGYTLAKKVHERVSAYKQKSGHSPGIILLQNHGIFVGGHHVEEIKETYARVFQKIKENLAHAPVMDELALSPLARKIMPVIRMHASRDQLMTVKIRHNSLVKHFYQDARKFEKVSGPFTPDNIVFCQSSYLYIGDWEDENELVQLVTQRLEDFYNQHGQWPRVILVKDLGLIALEADNASAQTVLDVFEDMMKTSFASESFSGPQFMNSEQIAFIEGWEAEKFRKSIGKSTKNGKVDNRIVIVTGGAQGFGEGIVRDLFAEGANVVIADIKKEKGRELASQLNDGKQKNHALFVQADISNASSVEKLVEETVACFGGLDVMLSNAGILRAGGLDEMDAKTFDLMTRVNYNAYFLCAKYASRIMKIQAGHHETHFMDIIQVNSKSGLKGSKKNFAYAGAKFGGLGLTQSFALELMPYRVKVNSICPGNFFDGPLWSDPENGLFVQYLNAGKVPGAKNLDDVKKYYEAQVPAGRGCQVKDVMRAVYYAIEQEYETGQAIPVTGGQNMLK